jgi:hypothetical protein
MPAIIETPEFIAWATKIWSDVERIEFIGSIADNPLAGMLPTVLVRYAKCDGRAKG